MLTQTQINKPKYLNIVAWNANGIRLKLQEFREFLARTKIDVALINETHLKPSHRANVPNYVVYRNDRLNGRAGGTAIYIKKSIPHGELLIPDEMSLEMSLIQIDTTRGKLFLGACYNPPSKSAIKNDFIKILQLTGNKNTVLAGDINAKHTDWNSTIINTNGRRLRSIADDLDLFINAPTSVTRIPAIENHRADVLDLVIVKNAQISPNIEVLNELSSDHLPILFTWGSGPGENHVRVVKSKTSWKDFAESLANFSVPNHISGLENRTKFLEENIQKALKTNTSTRLAPEFINDIPVEIHSLILARRKAIKTYKQTLSPQHIKYT